MPERPPPDEASRQEHTLDVDRIAAHFGTNIEAGLTASAASERLTKDGPNALTPPPKTPAFVKFLKQLVSGFGPILWIASILCFLAWRPLGAMNGGTPDPLNLSLSIVLLGVILLQASFNFYQEYKSDCIMDRLNAMIPANAMVTRDGRSMLIPVQDLVAGDLVTVSGGEKVPADLRIVSLKDMKLDKSTLNGESEPVRCSTKCTDQNFMETRNLAFFGCNVVEGEGTGVVIATGDRTVFGDIARLAATPQTVASTLHQEVTRFVLIIAGLSLSTGFAAFLGWFFWLRNYHSDFMSLPAIAVNCISLIVAFVPEGMPVAVTVTLALIAKEMSSHNVLVKNLGVVETLGAVSVIASDKTGTLTENRMTVSELSHQAPTSAHKELLRAMLLCNRASRSLDAEATIVGDASDSALLRHCISVSISGVEASPEATRAEWKKIAEIPFNSTNKYMVSIHCVPQEQDRLLMIKGAPERMLDRCSSFLTDSGVEESLTTKAKAAIIDSIEEAASRGQRILGFCQMKLEAVKFGGDFEFDVDEPNFPMQGLVFVGWAALRDPPRAGVKEAIAQCKSAYVRVAMVTGDHPVTAEAIARQVGIISTDEVDSSAALQSGQGKPEDHAVVLTGNELERFSDEDWITVSTYKQAVFARTTPKQKLRIVEAYQSQNECVAVTGDGVNDAPALRQANCGLAMGSGSEVSKEAADLIVLDDNFASVVKGIEHGRRCFANLKKVIIYLLPAGSWSEMWPVMTTVFLGMPTTLSAFLMVIICCGTDVGPSMALTFEKPESKLMTRRPRRLGKDHLVDWKLLANAYLFIGMMEAGVAYLTFFTYYYLEGIPPSDIVFQFSNISGDDVATERMNRGQSLYFYALLIMQGGNALTSRTAIVPIWKQNPFWGPKRNPRIFVALLMSAIILTITCYVPLIQKMGPRPLPTYWQPLVIPWFGAIFLVFMNESRKVLADRFPNGLIAKMAWC
jgi:sodium/potassium-transporting ATPase subunit alpha